MKYRVKFNEEVNSEIIQGGVSFSSNKPVILDSEEVELHPWFLGNPTFTCEEIKDEAAQDKADTSDAVADTDAGSASESVAEDDEATDSDRSEDDSEEVAPTPAPKRTRRKAASK
jgi:hypothetical protein